jgi:prepilin-type N-terminal cleavage/methylation domain-containing protein
MPQRPEARAFTLIEVLLSVAIIAVLIGLLAPTLGSVRERARELATLSTIGQHARVFAIYTADEGGAYPAFVPPAASGTTFFVNGGAYTINGYFGQVYAWQFGMAESYYDGAVTGPLFRRPGREPDLVSDYRYAASFMADPAFWTYSGRVGPSQWRGQRDHAVRFPGLKALLVDDRIMDELFGGGSGVMAMADGSARAIARTDVLEPFPPGEGDWPGTWSSGRPGVHTVEGVFGRDVR